MKRIKVVKDKNFTTINNEFIFKKELSLKAKGLLVHLLALPDHWKLYFEEVVSWHRDGKTSVRSAFNELMVFGYVKREQIREKGKIISWDYIVFERPQSENLKVEKLEVENQQLIKTNNKLKTNNNKKEILLIEYPEDLNQEAWNHWLSYRKEQFRSNYKPISEKAAIKKLLKIAPTYEEQSNVIIQSIENSWRGLFPLKNNQSKLKKSLDEYSKGKELLNNQFNES